jgi:arabinogalactan oligomer/maltooligosaccharide transport system substrate-binding protein
VAVLPAISEKNNAPAKPYVGGTGLYINANASDDQAKLAYEFAKFFATKGTEALVAKAGQFPASKDVALPSDNPNVKAWTDQYANGVALPNSPKMSNVWTPADDMVNKVMIGGADPATAAKDAAETINKAG